MKHQLSKALLSTILALESRNFVLLQDIKFRNWWGKIADSGVVFICFLSHGSSWPVWQKWGHKYEAAVLPLRRMCSHSPVLPSWRLQLRTLPRQVHWVPWVSRRVGPRRHGERPRHGSPLRMGVTKCDIKFIRLLNSLAPGRFEWYFRYLIFQIILVADDWGISCEIALKWMSFVLTDDKSALVQVMAWCRQATSHYLSQCWPRSLSPYGVTRPQWVNKEYMMAQLSIWQRYILAPLFMSLTYVSIFVSLSLVFVSLTTNQSISQ